MDSLLHDGFFTLNLCVTAFQPGNGIHCRLYFANFSEVLCCGGLLALQSVHLLLLLILSCGIICSLSGRVCSRVLRVVIKSLLNVFRQFHKITLEIPDFVLMTMPSGSTCVTVASLYSLPPTVLKSSASVSDAADSVARIAIVVFWGFIMRAFCLFCSPHCNAKLIRTGRNDARDFHGCNCASLQCVNGNTVARHSLGNSPGMRMTVQ
jgi:hypothetical protein